MMRIVYFEQKDLLLSHLEGLPGEKQFITPSPAKADGLRSVMTGTNDVITIAKFTSNVLELLWPDETSAPKVKRKSELLLVMGLMKNKYLPELGYEQFIQAWNLFSDLRSFTLDLSALSTVMESQPEIIQKAVQVFWAILGTGELCDEHGAYQAISEKLRSSEEFPELKKTFVFWGFQHLNGQQVDLLKALSIRYDVLIPLPLSLKDHLRRSDWPLWLKDHKTEETDLASEKRVAKGTAYYINSREISVSLKSLVSPGTSVVLGVSRLKPSYINLVPFSGVSFNIPHEILGDEIFQVATLLDEELPENCKGAELLSFLLKLKKTTLATKDFSFKLLRAIQLYEEAFSSIQGLTDDEIVVDEFYRKLLRDVSLLNQPRTSFVPLNQSEATVELRDMSSLEEIPGGKKVILCIDERFEDIQSLSQNYTESIQKELSAIGPLKRNELELLFKKWEFTSLFARADVSVLIPKGVLKHNLIWKRLFEDIFDGLVKDQLPSPPERSPLKDHLLDYPRKKFEGHFSASSLQTFDDCRQKFYFTYVEDLSPEFTLKNDVDNMLSGTISHKIIEEAHERNISPEKISDITTEVFRRYIDKNKLALPDDTYERHHLIFRQRAANGLIFLRELEKVAGEKITWKMETSFKLESDHILKGKIDCIGIGEKRIYLLDFKSSKGSAGKPSEILDFESLQLWVYSLAARKILPDFEKKEVVIGYVVLKDPETSVLATADESLYQSIKEAKLSELAFFEEPFADNLKKAEEVVQSLILAIQKEETFASNPSSKDACTYCNLSRICTKGALSVTHT
jgi:hypothetical protein